MKQILISCVLVSLIAFAGCGNSPETVARAGADKTNHHPASPIETPPEELNESAFGDQFPEVLAVEVQPVDATNWRFNVTLSSTYDSPSRYADAWRVLNDQDTELGIRILGHDHAAEQPFTRSANIQIPVGTKVVFVEGRDQANGWSGQRFEFKMPASTESEK